MLYIRTFGGLSISRDERMGSVMSGRNTKMWELLKYMLASYPNPVPTDKLIDAIWPGSDSGDPAKNIRDVVYRLRKALSLYGGGQDYILFINGCYLWNPDMECFIDCVKFTDFLNEAEKDGKSEAERIDSYYSAISLYRGEFLGEKPSDIGTWTSNFVSFYRRLFLNAVENLSYLHEKRLEYKEVIMLYNKAVLIEPYEESLYARQIQVLIKNGEYALAKRQYRQVEKIFLREFETAPSQTLQDLYEEAAKADIRQPMDLGRIKERFDESAANRGPILCAPDTFTQLYNYGKRADERITLPVFLGKMTLLSDGEKIFSKGEFERAMQAMRNILLENLRKGDIVCQYSSNQFLLMLTTHNAANIREGIKRINAIFERQQEWQHICPEMELIPIRDAE